MKKIMCIFITVAMLGSTALAEDIAELAGLYEKSAQVSSAEAQVVMSAELNSPLEFLDTIDTGDEADIDLCMIAESLVKSTAHMDYTYNMSDNYKKMRMSATVQLDTPLAFSDSFSIAAWSQFGMWVDYDLTELSAPVYKIIYKVPFYKKYLVTDLSAVYKENPFLTVYLDGNTVKDMSKKAINILLENADITAKDGGYELAYTDEDMKKSFTELIDLIGELSDPTGAAKTEYEKAKAGIADFFSKVTIFGEDGVKITVAKDEAGFISAQNTSAHIKLNIYDILTTYGMNTNGLERDKAFIDVTLHQESSFSGYNSASAVMPELTEENSVVSVDDPWGGYDREVILKNNTVYYPYEQMIEGSGAQVRTEAEGDTVTISVNGGAPVIVNGRLITCAEGSTETDVAPVIEEYGQMYCTQEVLPYLELTVYDIGYSKYSRSFTASFDYSGYVPGEDDEITEDEEESEPYEWVYVPPYLYYDFTLDRAAYYSDGAVYMPVYEFVQQLFAGEFGFGEGSIAYTAAEDNVFGISSVAAHTGDMYVTVNGEQMPLSAPVKEYDSVICIPVDYAKEIGLHDVNVNMYYSEDYSRIYSNYHFSMSNPEYKWDDPYYNSFTVYSDRLPYVKEGNIYLPVYDLFSAMYNGGFTFGENGFTYTAEGENRYDISDISVYTGDSQITVNGEQKPISDKIEDIDGVMRAPEDILDIFGLELRWIDITDTDDEASSVYNIGSKYTPRAADNDENRPWYEDIPDLIFDGFYF